MYRFLASPRWIVGLILTILAIGTMVRLGIWQLDRMHEKQARNAAITAARDAEPRPPAELIPSSPGKPPKASDEWAKVSITGSYDIDQTILIRQRSFTDGVGFEVVVPLHGDDGVTYLIDRGFVLAGARADEVPPLPQTPTGEVTVTGSVKRFYRADDAATRVEQVGGYQSVRALDPVVLSKHLGVELAGGYINAKDEVTADGTEVAQINRIPEPDLDEGPHLSYAVQWGLFALLTAGGFVYLARREAIDRLLAEDEWEDDDEDAAHDVDGAPAARLG